jgi:hypothetical protein
MPTRRMGLLALIIFSTACGDTAHRIDAAERRAAVAALAQQVEAHYIDAAAAQRIAAFLRARDGAGDYNAIRDDATLAQRLSSDLLQASHDARLRVEPLMPTPWPDKAGIASYANIAADIGYIDVTSFVAPDRSAQRYANAFGKLSGAKTIIVDLRNNTGGDADGLQLLSSYVVDRPIQYASLTRTGWQGGVVPDLATTGDALREAKRHILQDRLARVTTPMGRAALLALLKEL